MESGFCIESNVVNFSNSVADFGHSFSLLTDSPVY